MVYVVTNPEMGWDCVSGVFSSLDSLLHYFIDCGRSCYMQYDENDELYFPINENTTLEELEKYIQDGPYIIHTKTLK